MSIAPPPRFRGIFRQDADARAVYSEGAGIQRIDPVAVAVPADIDDLKALIEWAGAEGAALIPRGSGSGMAGAAIGRGVIVDLSRWNDIDETNLDGESPDRRSRRDLRASRRRRAAEATSPPRRSLERRVLHDRGNDGDQRRRRA